MYRLRERSSFGESDRQRTVEGIAGSRRIDRLDPPSRHPFAILRSFDERSLAAERHHDMLRAARQQCIGSPFGIARIDEMLAAGK